MSLFSQEQSHRHSSSEEKATQGWTQVWEDYSLCYEAAKESPVLDATAYGSPAMGPLPDTGDSVNSLLLDKLHIYTDFDEYKEEDFGNSGPKRKEEHAADALSSVEPMTPRCIGTDALLASPTEKLSPNEVFVFNIKYSTTKAQLEAVFSRCGAVACIILPFDEMASRIKGYAFIAFECDESVKCAIVEMNGFYLNGRPLSVRRKTECKSPSPRSKTPGITRSAPMFPFTDAVPISAAGGRRPLGLKRMMPTLATAVGETSTLFLGNVPFEVTHPQIWHLFSATCGNPVKSVRLVKTESGMPRGFGYVDFYSKEDARRALALNGHVICGRVLRVNYAEGYQPDYRKKKALQRSASSDALGLFQFADAFKATTPRKYGCVSKATPPLAAASAVNTTGFFPSASMTYLPVIEVPRGFYTLVPMPAASGSLMDAMRFGMAQMPVHSPVFLPPPDAVWAPRLSEAMAFGPF